jgi:hypothetical protein
MNGICQSTIKLILTGVLVFFSGSMSSVPTGFADPSPGHAVVPQSTGGMDTATVLGGGALPALEGDFEHKTVHPDRSVTLEIFNEKKVRTAKRFLNASGQLVEEWFFSPSAGNRILRYKIVHYNNMELLDERVAFWDYDEKGGYVKNNQVYDSKRHLTNSYVEYAGPNGIKFKEEWFDPEGRLTDRKTWDPDTGALLSNVVPKKLEKKQEIPGPLDETGTKSDEGALVPKAMPVLHQKERRTAQPDGSLGLEILDPQDRRTEKSLMDSKGHLIERWIFDPDAKGRIMGYESYEYRKEKLQQYRIAEWHYQANGERVKVNRIFDSQGKQTGGLVEYENAQGKKLQADWYNSKEKLVMRKSWDPENGALKTHMLVTYLVGGLQRRTFVDAKGQKLSENLYTPGGRPLGFGGVVLGNGIPSSADRFSDIKDRDREISRPLGRKT